MADNDDTTEISGQDARGGSTPGVTRYVLAASMVLIIVAFIAVYYFA